MLNKFARFLLVATALAPVALVHGVALLPASRWSAISFIVVALLLAFLCALVVSAAKKYGERSEVTLVRAKNVDREVLAFLVSYALPLITPSDKPSSALALWTIIALIAIVLYQTELVHVNPLLGMLGYKFLEVSLPTGETVLLITSGRGGATGTKSVVRISGGLWLEVTG